MELGSARAHVQGPSGGGYLLLLFHPNGGVWYRRHKIGSFPPGHSSLYALPLRVMDYDQPLPDTAAH